MIDRYQSFLWADKRIIKFFRKNFDTKTYRHLQLTYLGLCEIDSDLKEGKKIESLESELIYYTGLPEEIVLDSLKTLVKLRLVRYLQAKSSKRKQVKIKLILNSYDALESDLDRQPRQKFVRKNHNNNIYIQSLPNNFNLDRNKKDICCDPENDKNSKNKPKPKNSKDKPKPKIDIEKTIYFSFAKFLYESVNKYKAVTYTKDKIKKWAHEFRILHTSHNVDIKRIKKVLLWYRDNILGEYVPEAFSGYAFKKKFLRLEAAMERELKQLEKNKKYLDSVKRYNPDEWEKYRVTEDDDFHDIEIIVN